MIFFGHMKPHRNLLAKIMAINAPDIVERKLTLCFPKYPLFSKIAPKIESIWQPIHPTSVTTMNKNTGETDSPLNAPRIVDTTEIKRPP